MLTKLEKFLKQSIHIYVMFLTFPCVTRTNSDKLVVIRSDLKLKVSYDCPGLVTTDRIKTSFIALKFCGNKGDLMETQFSKKIVSNPDKKDSFIIESEHIISFNCIDKKESFRISRMALCTM